MHFKVHLLIICCIVIVVVLAWNVLQRRAATAPVSAAGAPPHVIAVHHASWGLNCKGTFAASDGSRGVFANAGNPADRLKEDNVLDQVSTICNGNVSCDIRLNEATLGPDPMPDCGSKTLEVEYRCFSYDRPWKVRSNGGSLAIQCEQPANR
jgi:hypothetical protein